jgi:predicted ribosome quality control (RQC) complex YloA/Tae2 family protein
MSAMAAALAGGGGTSSLLGEDGESVSVADEHEQLAGRLESRRDREAKRVAALTRQLAAAGPPETARELGQILLARQDGVPKGAESVVLQAFDGSAREIALDPALGAIANAERFFEEARRRERALTRLPAEIASAETRLAAFTDGLERLARTGPDEELWKLVGGRPDAGAGGRRGAPVQPEERLPYTRLRSSGGLEIRVGRGPRDNDALTFRHSSPEDIWLHASQASGAHVILRWGRRDENPPRRDLIEAAVAAAVNSGARHSGAVAVSWTRRKYVRKPRKSAPGSVVPDRVQTLLVEPDEGLVRALRDAADEI